MAYICMDQIPQGIERYTIHTMQLHVFLFILASSYVIINYGKQCYN